LPAELLSPGANVSLLTSLSSFRIGTVALLWFIDPVRFNDSHLDLIPNLQTHGRPNRMFIGLSKKPRNCEANIITFLTDIVYMRR
jgi:hypothetical protein